jgi:hypothetical protein
MATLEIDFEWTKAFAKSPGHAAYKFEDGKIRQVGRGKQRYSPLTNQSLYLGFAQLDGSPAACVGFAQNWGLLLAPVSLSRPPSEELSFWRSEIKRMRLSIQALPHVIRTVNDRGTFAGVGSINVLLVPGAGPNARPVMVMEPSNLLQAMSLEMAQAVAGGVSHADCAQCGKWFGRGGSRGSGGSRSRRSISMFCSEACKNRHHYERRAGK